MAKMNTYITTTAGQRLAVRHVRDLEELTGVAADTIRRYCAHVGSRVHETPGGGAVGAWEAGAIVEGVIAWVRCKDPYADHYPGQQTTSPEKALQRAMRALEEK